MKLQSRSSQNASSSTPAPDDSNDDETMEAPFALDQISEEDGIIKKNLTVYAKQESPESKEAKFRKITAQVLSCPKGFRRIEVKQIQLSKSSSTDVNIEISPTSTFQFTNTHKQARMTILITYYKKMIL